MAPPQPAALRACSAWCSVHTVAEPIDSVPTERLPTLQNVTLFHALYIMSTRVGSNALLPSLHHLS
jgi:hypothetical protein